MNRRWIILYGILITASVGLFLAARHAHHAYRVSHASLALDSASATRHHAGVSPEQYFQNSVLASIGTVAIAVSLFMIALFKRDRIAWGAFAVSIVIVIVTQLDAMYRV